MRQRGPTTNHLSQSFPPGNRPGPGSLWTPQLQPPQEWIWESPVISCCSPAPSGATETNHEETSFSSPPAFALSQNCNFPSVSTARSIFLVSWCICYLETGRKGSPKGRPLRGESSHLRNHGSVLSTSLTQ